RTARAYQEFQRAQTKLTVGVDPHAEGAAQHFALRPGGPAAAAGPQPELVGHPVALRLEPHLDWEERQVGEPPKERRQEAHGVGRADREMKRAPVLQSWHDREAIDAQRRREALVRVLAREGFEVERGELGGAWQSQNLEARRPDATTRGASGRTLPADAARGERRSEVPRPARPEHAVEAEQVGVALERPDLGVQIRAHVLDRWMDHVRALLPAGCQCKPHAARPRSGA